MTLELGGKSPNLVFADADLGERAAELRLVDLLRRGPELRGALAVLVEKSLYDEAVSTMAELAGGIRVGDPLDPETQMGSLISAAHRDRVHGFVERGARGCRGGRRAARCPTGGRFYPPTVVAATNDTSRAGGGLRPGRHASSRSRTRRTRSASRTTSATGSWRRSGRAIRRAAIASRARIKSGTVGINMPYTAFPGIPFGGYKQSGFGRELALETLDLYLETKSVIVSTGARPINPFGL